MFRYKKYKGFMYRITRGIRKSYKATLFIGGKEEHFTRYRKNDVIEIVKSRIDAECFNRALLLHKLTKQ